MPDRKINIDKLLDAYMELASSDPHALDDMLKEEGYDPPALEKKGILKIKQLLFQEEVQLKKNKLHNLYEKAVTMLNAGTSETKEMILSILRQKSPGLQFRNLEKLDEENLRQILGQTEILELI